MSLPWNTFVTKTKIFASKVNQNMVALACGLPFHSRLTLATGTPVTTTDQTAKTTLYLTPYRGGVISLFDGTDWQLFDNTEISIAVPATTSTMYDVFVYSNSGTPTLELLAWTNDTTRATALTLLNGIYVKTGVTTRRYAGSFRTTTASGQTEDSLAKRYVWNYYNRVVRAMRAVDTTDSWAYTTATLRQANANAANQLDCVIGVSEDVVKADVQVRTSNSTINVNRSVGIGIDSTSVNSAQRQHATGGVLADDPAIAAADYSGFPGVGRHYIVWLEFSAATGTTTWQGDAGAAINQQSGIIGELLG